MARRYLQDAADPRWIQIEKIGSTVWVHDRGQTFSWSLEKKFQFEGSKAAEKSNQLKAPMPGKVTKIFRNSGESIRAGDPVVVMEAMKMEYTLKFNQDGKIEKLWVAVGEQVKLGDILAELKED